MSNRPIRIETVFVDVFDTILTRNLYHPVDVFLRVRYRMADCVNFSGMENVVCAYPSQRMRAESHIRKQSCFGEEISYDDIYGTFSKLTKLDNMHVSLFASSEIHEETSAVVGIKSTVTLLNEIRGLGLRVVYISDMYLPESVVRQLLKCAGVLEQNDLVFVSSDVRKTKRSGSLYKHVLDKLELTPYQVVHVGDYLLSDYWVPRKLGIMALPVRIARSNIYETLWGGSCRCLYCSSIAGGSRAARVSESELGTSSFEATLFKLGANVLGPILVSFVLWTLQRAAEKGLRRLYFLSRDGEIILQIASFLTARLGYEIELRYLHVSRTAVFPARMGMGVDLSALNWLKEPTIIPTVRILADRLKVDAVTLFERLRLEGVGIHSIDTSLSDVELETVFDSLVLEPTLNGLLSESGCNAMESLEGYLQQEKFFDGTPSGLVDLGWHGGIQDVISTCFAERLSLQGITGYYFGVDNEGTRESRKEGYFIEPGSGEFRRFRHLFRVLIELLCSGSHGMVRGYQQDTSGRCKPILGNSEHPGNWERIKEIRRGCAAFMERLDVESLTGGDYCHVRPQILLLFKKLFFFPSRGEAAALGGLFFSADQAGHGIHEVAPAFSLSSALRFLMGKTYATRSQVSSWFFASWLLTPLPVRIVLFPLVIALRIYYCNCDLFSFLKLRGIDWFNRAIDTTKLPDMGANCGQSK